MHLQVRKKISQVPKLCKYLVDDEGVDFDEEWGGNQRLLLRLEEDSSLQAVEGQAREGQGLAQPKRLGVLVSVVWLD